MQAVQLRRLFSASPGTLSTPVLYHSGRRQNNRATIARVVREKRWDKPYTLISSRPGLIPGLTQIFVEGDSSFAHDKVQFDS